MGYAKSTTNAAGNGLAERLSALIETFRARTEQRRLYKRTLHELRDLNDRELADLGLSRSMLPRIAWQAAYGD